MPIWFDKGLIGSEEYHIVCEEGSRNSSSGVVAEPCPPWVVGSKEFFELLSVEGYSNSFQELLTAFPPNNWLKAFRSLLKDTNTSQVPWSIAMPSWVYNQFLEAFSGRVLDLKRNNKLNDDYYQGVYKRGNLVLDQLQPLIINQTKLKQLIANSSSKFYNKTVVSSFLKGDDGFPIKYSRTKSRTGRLVVVEGPDILKLNKELRTKILDSRFGNEGCLVSFDYKSLEPRFVINELTEKKWQCNSVDDVYQFIADSIDPEQSVPRKQLKKSTVSALYGSGLSSTANIRTWFGVETILTCLENNNVLDCGKQLRLVTKFGRKVSIAGVPRYKLLSYYAQTSCVDLVLLGFSAMVSWLIDNHLINDIVPVYVLHDEACFDVHKSKLHIMQSLGKMGEEIKELPGSRYPMSIKTTCTD